MSEYLLLKRKKKWSGQAMVTKDYKQAGCDLPQGLPEFNRACKKYKPTIDTALKSQPGFLFEPAN